MRQIDYSYDVFCRIRNNIFPENACSSRSDFRSCIILGHGKATASHI